MKNDIKQILLPQEVIEKRVREIGKEIDQYYQDREIIIITLLDGAIVFTADLIRNLAIPLRLDCLRVSSYGNSTDPETAPRILSSLKSDVRDKHVLLVDDILDTGNTLQSVFDEVSSKQPASVHSCVFLDKPERRQNGFKADWSGFSIPDEFVVGYGLDYAGRYRQLPFVGSLKPSIYS
ncbi:MAG: hypoxanthine phosphoribosyltransferase [Opitutales bacterium]|nr:hypoxanthine phosphoribosyltransferase [Opitutales bacterium]MDG1325973.1 hypoxanthine phosphoribosyltransferase [Opitutales bacterium]